MSLIKEVQPLPPGYQFNKRDFRVPAYGDVDQTGEMLSSQIIRGADVCDAEAGAGYHRVQHREINPERANSRRFEFLASLYPTADFKLINDEFNGVAAGNFVTRLGYELRPGVDYRGRVKAIRDKKKPQYIDGLEFAVVDDKGEWLKLKIHRTYGVNLLLRKDKGKELIQEPLLNRPQIMAALQALIVEVGPQVQYKKTKQILHRISGELRHRLGASRLGNSPWDWGTVFSVFKERQQDIEREIRGYITSGVKQFMYEPNYDVRTSKIWRIKKAVYQECHEAIAKDLAELDPAYKWTESLTEGEEINFVDLNKVPSLLTVLGPSFWPIMGKYFAQGLVAMDKKADKYIQLRGTMDITPGDPGLLPPEDAFGVYLDSVMKFMNETQARLGTSPRVKRQMNALREQVAEGFWQLLDDKDDYLNEGFDRAGANEKIEALLGKKKVNPGK